MSSTAQLGTPVAGGRHRRSLTVAFVLVVVFMVAEVVGGWLTGSLALLSDAGHMATDVLGLGMALAAVVAAERGSGRGRRTYGLYRAEILAALANALLLFGVAGYVLYEAVGRIGSPPEVSAVPMGAVALVGLVVNVVAWRLLRHGAGESLNIEGAYLEVVADDVAGEPPARSASWWSQRSSGLPAGPSSTRSSESASDCSSCRALGGWLGGRSACSSKPRPSMSTSARSAAACEAFRE